ncbi:hypothetical protein ABK040_005394 [Willaertia magna]
MTEFLEWLKEDGAIINEKLITIVESEESGRGLIASDIIEPNTTILSIPFTLFINIKTILFGNKFDKFKKKFIENNSVLQQYLQSNATQAIILTILFEKLINKGYWDVYIKYLPNIFTTPFYFKQHEIDLMSPIAKKLFLEKKENCLKEYQELCSILKNNIFFTKEDFIWAYHIVNTRCLYLDLNQNKKENNITLVPFLDLLNHSFEPNCKVEFKRNQYEVISIKTIQKGEEFLFTYGQHENTKLLIEYGFTVPKNLNNVVFLDDYLKNHLKSINIDDKLFQLNFNILKEKKLNGGKYIVDNYEGIGWKLKGALKVLLLTNKDHSLKQFHKWLQMDVSTQMLNEENEKKCLIAARELCLNCKKDLLQKREFLLQIEEPHSFPIKMIQQMNEEEIDIVENCLEKINNCLTCN